MGTTATQTITSTARRASYETIASSQIRVLRTFDSVRSWRRPHYRDSSVVGFVPTMGALHNGHLSLIRAAARESDHVVVSIYVNPTQFSAKEDLSTYPANWDADCHLLAELDHQLARDGTSRGRISAVFAPTDNVMHPTGVPGQEVESKGSFVTMTPIGEVLEGASRPTFFRGVATHCMKLFNPIQPDRAFFGQKDVQQAAVIKKMVKDFLLPIDISVCPTERDPDGLALSSRNVYLGERRRQVATVLIRALQAAAKQYHGGATDRDAILGAANQVVAETQAQQAAMPATSRVNFEVDYISLAEPDTMEEVAAHVNREKGAILSGAIKMFPVEMPQPGEELGHSGGLLVRLIDNVVLEGAI
ncbi:pantoate-beta-alanine ligase [Diaporthe australafricana]|uniref:Pantoate--beta-alanine ligase n=1 Tax=Diaporthe australafricana TaxID=127596 RepID=A0ABR3X1D5_9PEZI